MLQHNQLHRTTYPDPGRTPRLADRSRRKIDPQPAQVLRRGFIPQLRRYHEPQTLRLPLLAREVLKEVMKGI